MRLTPAGRDRAERRSGKLLFSLPVAPEHALRAFAAYHEFTSSPCVDDFGSVMHLDGVIAELTCPACGARQRCGPTQMMQRLSEVGMMKRRSDPDLELLQELFRSAAARFHCRACDAVGLTVSQAGADDMWDDVRQCDGCRQPIPAERLEVFPDATRCAACQSSSESGGDQPREFCEHCGCVMTIRVRRSAGPAAYEMHCPNCGR